jgi:hypothetical protein
MRGSSIIGRYIPFTLTVRLVSAIGLAVAALMAACPAQAKDDQPWTSDPQVAEVLTAIDRIDAAILANDVDTFGSLLAMDFILNNTRNMVADRASVLERFGDEQISYSSYERKIDFAGVRGDDVVVMGEEILKPKGKSPGAGRVIRRRFTDIWRNEDGAWRLRVRQATVISIE